MSRKALFSRALALAPQQLHFAAHSHHLWPDASFDGQMQAWEDANRHADDKWDLIFGQVIPEAQGHIAAELDLPSPDNLVFAPNTHD
ncbi:MAG: class V aminotransferase, partial [Brevundimonas sp.]